MQFLRFHFVLSNATPKLLYSQSISIMQFYFSPFLVTLFSLHFILAVSFSLHFLDSSINAALNFATFSIHFILTSYSSIISFHPMQLLIFHFHSCSSILASFLQLHYFISYHAASNVTTSKKLHSCSS